MSVAKGILFSMCIIVYIFHLFLQKKMKSILHLKK
jgi:hypothetical protein